MSRHFALLPKKASAFFLSCLLGVFTTASTAGTGDFAQASLAGKAVNFSSGALLKADNLEQRAFEAVNKERMASGLPALKLALQMQSVAREHSLDMLRRDYFAHQSPEGKDLRHRLERHGINNWLRIAENIAYNSGYEDPVLIAVEGWMKSPGHRKNILNRELAESAIGVAVSADGRAFFTQVFAKLDEKGR
jgi:uncharacterized protein YkwD